MSTSILPDPRPVFVPLGDQAVQVTFKSTDAAGLERLSGLSYAIQTAKIGGLVEIVLGIETCTIFYDSTFIDYDELCLRIENLPLDASTSAMAARTIEIPMLYGGNDGSDLGIVAATLELTEARVIELHSTAEYRVRMIGFAPGFPYLVGLPAALELPRLDSPRARVAAGSVGIAGPLTGIYPQESPGGWRILGRTPLKLFSIERTPPTLLAPGERVRFRPIDADEFARLAAEEA